MEEGTPCLARFSDDNSWYRAEMKAVPRFGEVEVLFVDYGNSEKVKMSEILAVPNDLMRFPRFAFECGLNGITWSTFSTDFLELIESKLLEKTFSLRIFDDSSAIAKVEFLDAAGKAVMDEITRHFNRNIEGPRKTTENFALSAAENKRSNNAFSENGWLPDSGSSKKLPNGTEAKPYRSRDSHRTSREDDWDAGERRADRSRSRSSSSTGRRNSDRSSADSNWRSGHGNYQRFVPPRLQNRRDNRNDNFAGKSHYNEQPTSPELTKSSKVPEMTIIPCIYQDVTVVHVESISEFYVNLSASSLNFATLSSDICRTYEETEHPALEDPSVGDFCCVQFSADNRWYRAVVKAVGNRGQITVQFIDFGNCDTVNASRVKGLDPKFADLPIMAIKCRLENVTPFLDRESDVVKLVESRFLNKPMVARFTRKDGDGYSVRLVDSSLFGDISVNSMLVADSLAFPVDKTDFGYRSAAVRHFRLPPQGSMLPLDVECGTTSNVVLTSFFSPNQFYCQIAANEDSINRLCERLNEVYRSGACRELLARDVVPNTVCVAFYDDSINGGWYRAAILKMHSSDEVLVFLVDFGDVTVVTKAKLKAIQPEFLDLPAQAICCSLSGIEPKWHFWRTADKTLMGKYFQGDYECKFVRKLHQTYFVDVTCNDCRLNPFQVALGVPENVYISFIVSPNKFFLQKASDEDTIASLSEELVQFYSELTEHELTSDWQIGTYCVARYSEDMSWYRGLIADIAQDGSIFVKFVDFGNTEKISSQDVRSLREEFRHLPILSTECFIENLPEQMTDEDFRESTINGEEKLVAKFKKMVSDDKFVVSLTDVDGSDVGEKLRSKFPQQDSEKTDRDDVLPIGQRMEVTLAYLDSARSFFLQLKANEQSLNELQESMQSIYNESVAEDDQEVVTGSVCVAKFSEDEVWYRARVVAVEENDCTVHFMDFGNQDTVFLSDIRLPIPELTALSPFAIECSLFGLPAESDEDLENRFSALMLDTDKQFLVELLEELDGKRFTVKLYCDNTCLNDQLLASDSAVTRSEDDECLLPPFPDFQQNLGEAADVLFPYWVSPSEFWIHRISEVAAKDALQTQLQEEYSESKPDFNNSFEFSVGTPCVAIYGVDNTWCRAVVRGLSNSGLTVNFVDFGNTEIVPVESVRNIDERFKEPAVFAAKCSLNREKEWTRREIETFEDLICLGERNLSAKFLEKRGDTYIVKLNLGENDFVDILVSDDEAAAVVPAADLDLRAKFSPVIIEVASLSEPKIIVGQKMEAVVSNVVSPSRFHIQKWAECGELAKLSRDLDAHYAEADHEDREWHVGEFCCCKYSLHDKWYRARISSLEEETANVLFVDFGFEDSIPITTLRSLAITFVAKPVFAVECCLFGAKPPVSDEGWCCEAIVTFGELLGNENTKVLVEFVSRDRPFPVRLLNMGVDVTKALCHMGFVELDDDYGLYPNRLTADLEIDYDGLPEYASADLDDSCQVEGVPETEISVITDDEERTSCVSRDSAVTEEFESGEDSPDEENAASVTVKNENAKDEEVGVEPEVAGMEASFREFLASNHDSEIGIDSAAFDVDVTSDSSAVEERIPTCDSNVEKPPVVYPVYDCNANETVCSSENANVGSLDEEVRTVSAVDVNGNSEDEELRPDPEGVAEIANLEELSCSEILPDSAVVEDSVNLDNSSVDGQISASSANGQNLNLDGSVPDSLIPDSNKNEEVPGASIDDLPVECQYTDCGESEEVCADLLVSEDGVDAGDSAAGCQIPDCATGSKTMNESEIFPESDTDLSENSVEIVPADETTCLYVTAVDLSDSAAETTLDLQQVEEQECFQSNDEIWEKCDSRVVESSDPKANVETFKDVQNDPADAAVEEHEESIVAATSATVLPQTLGVSSSPPEDSSEHSDYELPEANVETFTDVQNDPADAAVEEHEESIVDATSATVLPETLCVSSSPPEDSLEHSDYELLESSGPLPADLEMNVAAYCVVEQPDENRTSVLGDKSLEYVPVSSTTETDSEDCKEPREDVSEENGSVVGKSPCIAVGPNRISQALEAEELSEESALIKAELAISSTIPLPDTLNETVDEDSSNSTIDLDDVTTEHDGN